MRDRTGFKVFSYVVACEQLSSAGLERLMKFEHNTFLTIINKF